MNGISLFINNINAPYRPSLLDGLREGPKKRFVKFFEEKEKFDYFMGIEKSR
jgi:hypothetical protein